MPHAFVYGALMDHPDLTDGVAAVVHGYAVQFVAPGVPILEPVFAALVAEPQGEAHGVVFETDEATWARLLTVEEDYERIDVVAHTHAGPVACQALVYPGADAREGRPSARYMARLCRGARNHQLPQGVIDRYERRRNEGSTISLRLIWLQAPVTALVPHVGLIGAVSIVLTLLLLPVFIVVGMGLWWLGMA